MATRRTFVKVSTRVAIACCAYLIVTIAAMTAASRSFLADHQWSPVHRTPTEWPSLLALAPHGWIISTAFALCGLGAFALAWAVSETVPRLPLLAAGFFVTAGIGLLGVAFPADLPSADRSWHGQVHNTFYNLIPLGLCMSMLYFLAAGAPVKGWVSRRSLAGVSLALLITFISLTLINPIAQLARYGVLLTMLAWVLVVAATTTVG